MYVKDIKVLKVKWKKNICYTKKEADVFVVLSGKVSVISVVTSGKKAILEREILLKNKELNAHGRYNNPKFACTKYGLKYIKQSYRTRSRNKQSWIETYGLHNHICTI